MQVPPVSCGSRSQCSPALSAAVTAIPGVVFSGGVSGYLRAYATDDARLLWEVDTARDYPTVNGVSARGGAMDGPGPTIVDGMLYVNSGYAQWGGLPATSCWPSKSRIPDSGELVSPTRSRCVSAVAAAKADFIFRNEYFAF